MAASSTLSFSSCAHQEGQADLGERRPHLKPSMQFSPDLLELKFCCQSICPIVVFAECVDTLLVLCAGTPSCQIL